MALALGGWGCARTTAPVSANESPAQAETSGKQSHEEKKLEKEESKEVKEEKKEEKDVPKAEIRNNAASLLADLLGDEKNVSKILILKHPSPSTKRLIETISKQADDGSKQLQQLARNDASLKLDAIQLPPGERAARDAETKTKEKALLLTFGRKSEFNLLLTQAEALNYGSNLAKVAGDNSASEEEQRTFKSLQTSLNDLYERVFSKMSGIPEKS
jgi:hypothetical protein